MDIKKPKIIGVVWGAIVASLWISFATVYGELNHVFKDWLAVVFGHHWVAKGIIAAVIVAVFIALGLFIKKLTARTLTAWLLLLFWITIIGIIIITWFFASHAF